MNDNKELKMQLLKEFGITDELKSVDFCREAYKFIIESESKDSQVPACGSLDAASEKVTAIDLGLPSGTLWADRNVGAKSPTDYGAYFSWGNIEGYFPNDEKLTHDWGDNEDCFAMPFDEENYAKTKGAEQKSDIGLDNDAARHHMGQPWKIPTKEQFKELYDSCVVIRKTIDGVNGLLFTSKINGNTLFFPAAGLYNGTSLYCRGSYGYYWSSSYYDGSDAYYLYFSSSNVDPQSDGYRYRGRSVRAVQ